MVQVLGDPTDAYKKLANSSMQVTTAYDRMMLAQVQEKAGFRQMEFGMRAGRPRCVWWRIQRGNATTERTVRQSKAMAVGERILFRSVLITLYIPVRIKFAQVDILAVDSRENVGQ